MKGKKTRTLVRIDLNPDDSVSLSSDLENLDTDATSIEAYVAAMMSYVPSFNRSLRSMTPKSVSLVSIAMQVFFAAACAQASNGEQTAATFNRLVRAFSENPEKAAAKVGSRI